MSDASAPGAAPKDPAQRPLWQWILRALSPSLFYVGFASLTFLVPSLAVLSMFVSLIVALIGIFVLFSTADDFFTARNDPSAGRQVLFFVGFFILNTMIWFGGCGITAHNLDFMLPEKGRSRPPVERTTDEPPATPSNPPPSPSP